MFLRSIIASVTVVGILVGLAVPASAEFTDPTSISGLMLWLDAQDIQADGTATTAGTTVSTWKDKSGNGKDATATGDPTTAVFSDGTLGNQGVVGFDGDDFFTAPVDISAGTTPQVTVIAVYKWLGDDTSGLWGNDNGSWDRFVLLNHSAGEGVSKGSGMQVIDELNDPSRGFGILSVAYNKDVANGSRALLDGAKPAAWTSSAFTETTNGDYGNSTLTIGAINGSPNSPAEVDIAELLVYNKVLTLAEENQVGYYLQEKYSLTGDYVPEPGSIVLFAIAAIALLGWRWRSIRP